MRKNGPFRRFGVDLFCTIILLYRIFNRIIDQNDAHRLCEILEIPEIAKNKNAEMTGFSEPVLLYTALFSQTAKK